MGIEDPFGDKKDKKDGPPQPSGFDQRTSEPEEAGRPVHPQSGQPSQPGSVDDLSDRLGDELGDSSPFEGQRPSNKTPSVARPEDTSEGWGWLKDLAKQVVEKVMANESSYEGYLEEPGWQEEKPSIEGIHELKDYKDAAFEVFRNSNSPEVQRIKNMEPYNKREMMMTEVIQAIANLAKAHHQSIIDDNRPKLKALHNVTNPLKKGKAIYVMLPKEHQKAWKRAASWATAARLTGQEHAGVEPIKPRSGGFSHLQASNADGTTLTQEEVDEIIKRYQKEHPGEDFMVNKFGLIIVALKWLTLLQSLFNEADRVRDETDDRYFDWCASLGLNEDNVDMVSLYAHSLGWDQYSDTWDHLKERGHSSDPDDDPLLPPSSQ